MAVTNADTWAFLVGGGELGELTRTKDWSQTPIGLPEQWPQSLRTILGMVLHAQAPMFLWWGTELIQFYNDAYRPSLGITGKHPTALGQCGRDCWPETWPTIKPLIDKVLAGGSAGAENQLIPIYRNGRLEDVYWSFGYSPIWNEIGQVAGVLVICQETTQKVVVAREEQARFRFAMEVAQFGIWEVDPVTNLVHWDKRSAGLFGLTSNQAIPYETAIRHIYPDDLNLVNEAVRRGMDPQSDGQYDLIYRTIGAEDSLLRWVRFRGRSVFNQAGELNRFSGIAHEVTHEVLARQAVEANAAYLQRVFRSAAIGMAIFEGPHFVIEVANPSVCAIWGRTEFEVLGKPLFEALPEAAGQGFEELLAGVMATRQPFVGRELPAIINRLGQFTTVYFDFVYEPLPDDQGQVNRILVTASDATERRQVRQHIEASEANLRSLFAQAPVAICILRGPELIYQMANELYLTIVGRSNLEDLVGKSLLKALPELREQGIDALIKGVMSTGIAFSATERSVDLWRNGQLETGYFNFIYEPLRDADQSIAGVFVTVTEVTQQILARQRVEANEAYLQRIFRHAAVTLAIFRGPEFIIELANNAVCAVWGRTEAQVLGKPLFEALPELIGQGFEQLLTDVLQTGVPFVGVELPATIHRNGLLIPGYYNLVFEPLFEADGRASRILQTATEVTELVLARQQTDKLLDRERELNELKSNFVTLASHEFRTPMGTILSSASLIGHYNGPNEVDKRDRHVQRIKSAVHSLTGLLNDFLSLSQMEQATIRGRPQPIDIKLFCAELMEDMQDVIKPGQRLIYQHQSGQTTILLDGQMLKNILINLLVNASKYSTDEKEIELMTAVAGEQLLITVKDEGIGIPDTDKDKLFISFFRSRNVAHVAGTGLGLYIVKRYVDLLGGTITFTSELDSGTIFTIQLPLATQSQ